MNKLKGFTIIELIVVIAIIAVLATIVLVNVTGYINKGKDASIKGNVATIMTNAAVYYDSNGNYTNFPSSTGYSVPAAAITSTGKTVINGVTATTGAAYCACATLFDSTNGTYCVDSTGYKKQTNTACGTRCSNAAPACAD